jgi:tetratricopeptide (TPR) repeat protein
LTPLEITIHCEYFYSDITSLFLLQGTAPRHYAEKMRALEQTKTFIASALCVLSAACAISVPVSLARADDTAAQALYEAGKFDEALREFRALRGESSESPQYFYNVGTTALKAGQPGMAVAYLAKANRLKPHDSETQRNLKLAQTALGRLLSAERMDPASSALEATADRMSIIEIRGTLGLLGLIVMGLWLRAYLRTRNLKRTLLQPSGMVALIGFVITLGLYAIERLTDAYPPAYAIERVTIRSGPGSQFAQLGQLEAGVKIRQLGFQNGWEQIRYSQDGIGWVPVSSLLLF